MDGPGFESGMWQDIFLFSKTTWTLGPTYILINEFRGFFLEIERPEPEVKNPPPSSVEINNEWIYTR
jgi:hypothetical protein